MKIIKRETIGDKVEDLKKSVNKKQVNPVVVGTVAAIAGAGIAAMAMSDKKTKKTIMKKLNQAMDNVKEVVMDKVDEIKEKS